MKAILLVGGLGTRLRSAVPSLPKALASVGRKPFLQLLVQQLATQGFRELVMCTGYRAEQIEEAFGDGRDFGVSIQYSRESAPLGTAGAIRLARSYLQHDDDFLVLNGDSLAEINFNGLVAEHRKHKCAATIAVVPVQNTSRYGTVKVDSDRRVLAFLEKTGETVPGVINAGVYVFDNTVLGKIPEGEASLERDVFPGILEQGVYAVPQPGLFIDIGTPEDYARAGEIHSLLVEASTATK
jgi:NDP-sugar pyrophosphorylase family protein